jgi:predicted PhzF superfamily epimerase YddE/YHI9
MQQVAAEMNLSETAFVVTQGPGRWGLRWFTPAVEVDLCGHATLASAHVLWEQQRQAAGEPVRFTTRASGELTCRQLGEWIAMDFPARPVLSASAPPGLLEALGGPPVTVGRTAHDYLVELASEAAVRELRPDFARLATLPVRGVIVTAASDGGEFDFVSRFFAPGAGVMEDPVTGSAHCSLGPYWAGRLGRRELRGWQASARGGEVMVNVGEERVELRGRAFTVWQGALLRSQ